MFSTTVPRSTKYLKYTSLQKVFKTKVPSVKNGKKLAWWRCWITLLMTVMLGLLLLLISFLSLPKALLSSTLLSSTPPCMAWTSLPSISHQREDKDKHSQKIYIYHIYKFIHLFTWWPTCWSASNGHWREQHDKCCSKQSLPFRHVFGGMNRSCMDKNRSSSVNLDTDYLYWYRKTQFTSHISTAMKNLYTLYLVKKTVWPLLLWSWCGCLPYCCHLWKNGSSVHKAVHFIYLHLCFPNAHK